jgi:hypothetical protein
VGIVATYLASKRVDKWISDDDVILERE